MQRHRVADPVAEFGPDGDPHHIVRFCGTTSFASAAIGALVPVHTP